MKLKGGEAREWKMRLGVPELFATQKNKKIINKNKMSLNVFVKP